MRQADQKSIGRRDRIGSGEIADREGELRDVVADEALVVDVGDGFHDPEIALQADEVHLHLELDLGMRLAGEDEAHEHPPAAENHRNGSRAQLDIPAASSLKSVGDIGVWGGADFPQGNDFSIALRGEAQFCQSEGV